MKTLKLFNAVLANGKSDIFVSEDGYIIDCGAAWAKDKIVDYYNKQKLSGQDLNKTFYKSFEKVRQSSRFELYLDQIRHYASTYGSNFQDEIYIPDDVLDLPEVKLSFKLVKGLTKEELIERCLSMLKSGIALTEETIDDVLSVLVDELDYTFTGEEGIRNKEAIIKIADTYGVIPTNTMEFFRYIVYKATGDSLLIKNKQSIQAIKKSSFNPGPMFKQHGLEKSAEIFNRFKPLFLAFKDKCPKTINKISKYSKHCHKPAPVNALNEVTQRKITSKDFHWFDNATPFALFKALSAVHNRMQGQSSFCYRIRNGKSWVKDESPSNKLVMLNNFNVLLNYLKGRFDFSNKTILLNEDIEYALPTSEKMFVGNIPTGTKFYGEKLAVGIYWENSWGANDLDLSASDIDGGKIGWNSRYYDIGLTYSGDITSAPNGAVEYLHCQKGTTRAYLVNNNIYYGNDNSQYKIIVGRGDDVSRQYMMNPNNLLAEVKTEAVQKKMTLGLFLPESNNRQSFVLLNFGSGHARVAAGGAGVKALYEQYRNPLTFKEVVEFLGAKVIYNKDDAPDALDFSIDNLSKDNFINLFKESK